MFIPLHDANTLKRIKLQYVTFGLIGLNVAIWLLTSLAGQGFTEAAVMGLGYIPSTISGSAERPDFMIWVPDGLTFLTYAFLHGDFFHLAGNMLFLWVFGDNVEDALGHVRYLAFYLLCAAAGAGVHFALAPNSEIPLIGASGAVAGIVTAYLVLHPRVKVWILAFGRIPLRIPAWIAIAAWIVFQFVMFLGAGEEQISWSAHIGGILAGGILVVLLRRRDQPLLDKQIVTPRAVVAGEAPGRVPLVPRAGGS